MCNAYTISRQAEQLRDAIRAFVHVHRPFVAALRETGLSL
jgi:hypothetical protein